MSEQASPGGTDDPRVEIVQAVYDRVNSYDDSATPERIRQELDEALAKSEVDLDDAARERLVALIDEDGGREQVAGLLS